MHLANQLLNKFSFPLQFIAAPKKESIMYTKRFYILIQIICFLSCLLGPNAVIYKRKANLFFYNKFTEYRLYFTALCMILLDFFMIFRTIQAYYRNNDIQAFNHCYSLTLIFTVPCIGIAIMALYVSESCLVLTQLLRFVVDFESKLLEIFVQS
jgi:hypothetical protein